MNSFLVKFQRFPKKVGATNSDSTTYGILPLRLLPRMSQDSGTNVLGFSHESYSINGSYQRTIPCRFMHKSSSKNVIGFKHKYFRIPTQIFKHEWQIFQHFCDQIRTQIFVQIGALMVSDSATGLTCMK